MRVSFTEKLGSVQILLFFMGFGWSRGPGLCGRVVGGVCRLARHRIGQIEPGRFPVKLAPTLVLRDIIRRPGFIMSKIRVPTNIESAQSFGLVFNVKHLFRRGIVTG